MLNPYHNGACCEGLKHKLGLHCREAFPRNTGMCCEGKCYTHTVMNMC